MSSASSISPLPVSFLASPFSFLHVSGLYKVDIICIEHDRFLSQTSQPSSFEPGGSQGWLVPSKFAPVTPSNNSTVFLLSFTSPSHRSASAAAVRALPLKKSFSPL